MTAPRIGILGAPGTGKGDLSDALTEALGQDDHVVQIHAAGDSVEHGDGKVWGYPVGPDGTWRTSLALHFWNESEREFLAIGGDTTLIEVGTGLDRMAHCGQRLVDLSDRLLELDGAERLELVQLQAAMPAIAIVLAESWNYDYAFLLLPDEGCSDYEAQVHSALLELINSYEAAGTDLGVLSMAGTTEERVEAIVQILNEFEPKRLARLAEIEEAEARVRAEGDNSELARTGGEASEGAE